MRTAIRRPGAASVLPGGRIIAPLGSQFVTGPGPFGIAVSPSGRTVVSANGGPDKYSLTILERDKKGTWTSRHFLAPGKREMEGDKDDDWRSVFMGVTFAGEHGVYFSEGETGRVRLMDLSGSSTKRLIDLNEGEFHDSYTGDLALDADRGFLYVVDQANFRLAVIDIHKNRIAASVRLGRVPFAVALSADKRKAYVTNIGMFEYKPVPGADPKQARETGLPFPAFGFPSAESRDGARRETARGPVDVPGLGDPNVRESNSVCVVNLEEPSAPKVEAFIRTGLPFGGAVAGGSSPSGILAAGGKVYVSNGHNDSITVIDPANKAVSAEVPIRMPRLENVRGVLPIGMAYHEGTGWLLVAGAGINAITVIDTKNNQVIGLLPAAWFPTAVAIGQDTVFVANARGQGTGPNVDIRGTRLEMEAFLGTLRRGSISHFPLPARSELAGHTSVVLEANGFNPSRRPAVAVPDAVKHVVLIVKENRTFDEVFGDIREASNSQVLSAPPLARFGRYGYALGRNRLSIQRVNVTPNHHQMAARWSFSDNFYADSDVSVDGHHWLVGSYPNAWTQSSLMAAYGGEKTFRMPTTAPGRLLFAGSNSSVHPEEQLEAGTIWHHLDRNKISFRNFGEGFELAGVDEGPGLKPTGARFVTNVPMPDLLYRNTSRDYPQFNMNIPDQFRASQFIAEIEQKYVKGGESFPQFIYIHLPNDHTAEPRPEDGYAYEASFIADNDYALGRIVEYLSNTPWWREMAIFVTEDDSQSGVDHIDAHRTVLLGVGPYFKHNYVSHMNVSFPGLLKTIFRLLKLPPLNLFDAAASDLADMFSIAPDFAPYQVQPVDARIFDPAMAREPLDPKPSPAMDDPRVIRQQMRRF
jgi:YVTN family beta-propeller protein